jgi:FkbM family methyltransferase
MTDFSLYDLWPDLPPLEIVDVGAYEDPFDPSRHAALAQAGRARIIGFEPNLEGCLRLNTQFGKPHSFFPLFIGDGQPATFHATNRVQTGSLFPPNQPLLELFRDLQEVTTPVADREVKTARLDDVVDREIDYLKIDVQGAELGVLRGASRVLESVLMIRTEVEFVEYYKGQPLFAEVDTHLRACGFWFHTFAKVGSRTFKPFLRGVIDRGVNQMLWADAIYVRPSPLDLATLPDAKLWKLAILLHDLVGSDDFAHLCLSTIDARGGSAFAAAYRERLPSGGVVYD